jgi:hypothetical protein
MVPQKGGPAENWSAGKRLPHTRRAEHLRPAPRIGCSSERFLARTTFSQRSRNRPDPTSSRDRGSGGFRVRRGFIANGFCHRTFVFGPAFSVDDAGSSLIFGDHAGPIEPVLVT